MTVDSVTAIACSTESRKQPSARKPRPSPHELPQQFHSDVGPQTCVKRAVLPRRSSVRAGHQCRVGNAELQMLYVHEANPLAYMTIAHCQVAGRVVETFRAGSLRSHSIEPGRNIIAKA